MTSSCLDKAEPGKELAEISGCLKTSNRSLKNQSNHTQTSRTENPSRYLCYGSWGKKARQCPKHLRSQETFSTVLGECKCFSLCRRPPTSLYNQVSSGFTSLRRRENERISTNPVSLALASTLQFLIGSFQTPLVGPEVCFGCPHGQVSFQGEFHGSTGDQKALACVLRIFYHSLGPTVLRTHSPGSSD